MSIRQCPLTTCLRASQELPDRFARVAASRSRQPTLRVRWLPTGSCSGGRRQRCLGVRRERALHQCINDWAMASRVEVLSIKRRWLLLGPWQWRASGWSRVFALSIGDDRGPAREAFAKVGRRFRRSSCRRHPSPLITPVGAEDSPPAHPSVQLTHLSGSGKGPPSGPNHVPPFEPM